MRIRVIRRLGSLNPDWTTDDNRIIIFTDPMILEHHAMTGFDGVTQTPITLDVGVPGSTRQSAEQAAARLVQDLTGPVPSGASFASIGMQEWPLRVIARDFVDLDASSIARCEQCECTAIERTTTGWQVRMRVTLRFGAPFAQYVDWSGATDSSFRIVRTNQIPNTAISVTMTPTSTDQLDYEQVLPLKIDATLRSPALMTYAQRQQLLIISSHRIESDGLGSPSYNFVTVFGGTARQSTGTSASISYGYRSYLHDVYVCIWHDDGGARITVSSGAGRATIVTKPGSQCVYLGRHVGLKQLTATIPTGAIRVFPMISCAPGPYLFTHLMEDIDSVSPPTTNRWWHPAWTTNHQPDVQYLLTNYTPLIWASPAPLARGRVWMAALYYYTGATTEQWDIDMTRARPTAVV